MPVTVTIANQAAENWKAPKVRTASELLKEVHPKEHESMKRILGSSFATSFLSESHISASPNGFVYSAYIAYGKHHHLTIRPDNVWFAILSQLGFYLGKHSKPKRLRCNTVLPEGTKQITLAYRDGHSSGSRIYAYLAQKLNDEIFDEIQDPLWATPSFTTTTDTDRAVASALLMGTMQPYYECDLVMLCGLPSVTLLGEIEDWQEINGRIDYLYQLDRAPLTRFANMLRPILRHMIHSFTHPTSEEIKSFWNTMVTTRPPVDGEYVVLSGWITAFCNWNEEGTFSSHASSLPGLDGELYPIVQVKNLPAGSASVPVKVTINEELCDCTMVAGSVGIQAFSLEQREIPADTMSRKSQKVETPPSKQDPYGLQTIQPVSGWWIVERTTVKGDGSYHSAGVNSVERIKEKGSAFITIDLT
ncbi:hypothetical protein TGAM01_v200287 [Trichoderma gamsii]|uniref:Uncharacterized protein n=1 Tax=Trichoderma gamsii TaxID=398673 RepID=A0A2P5A2U7_9HYPO|nr:hypothetical protein TGAM01_v200287 [Trichoderma gamsii]PON30867.1 hypothetical protein TGAM01_v200287 [Trichoderma gamsii]